ncbi:ABC-type transporter, permease component [Methanobrevibacter arboriphilus JCM 13429 = DSM 1125]|uniref:ABC-type transporter, permease component n=1 Tax=Methanobrevibacter arboriphilus JCM 13429 = DSM 1125 TaxID=1300164 RepID=A0A1V6N148_METAZ|nr:ABC transporter permease [Methanobrevibacter arboriphilus]OQD58411.1 ABC-type transporter, permease component [Methanobrevibacter arboriphilus JCM 13429 = DSM 1125]
MNKKVLSLIIPVTLIIIWFLITMVFKVFPDYIIPTPLDVLNAGYSLIITGQLLDDTINTLFKVLLGIILATIVAVPLGLILGWSERLEAMSELIVSILRPIPPVAWIPFSLLWFGIGIAPAVFIIFMGCIFPILVYTIDGVKRTDKVLIEAGQTLGANDLQILSKVIFPSSFPTIVTGLKVAFGIDLMCTVSAEMVGSTSGLGQMIMTASTLSNTGDIVIGMLAIGIIGLVFDRLFIHAQRKIFW